MLKHPMQNPPKTLDRIRLHHFLPTSRANGPGLRAVIWLQGCTLGCPGCFNPQTHSKKGGDWVSVDQLFSQVMALQSEIQGVTISGGEPLQQMRPLLKLLQRLRVRANYLSCCLAVIPGMRSKACQTESSCSACWMCWWLGDTGKTNQDQAGCSVPAISKFIRSAHAIRSRTWTKPHLPR